MCPNRSGSVSTDLIVDFVAGGLGAAASVIVGQPLDTVKVRRVNIECKSNGTLGPDSLTEVLLASWL